jgi:hypothetical protein
MGKILALVLVCAAVGEQKYPNPMYGHATIFFPPMSARFGFEIAF